jgi:signal transduction histidine kinase
VTPENLPALDDAFPALTLYRLGKLVTASLDLDSTLEAIVDAAHQLTGAESTAILVQDDGEHLVIRVGRGPVAEAIGERVPVGAGVVGRALLEGRPILVDDMQIEPGRARPDLDARLGVRSYLAAPLVWRGDTLGVVTLGSGAPGVFAQSHCQLVAELAEQAAAAVAHARAYSEELARREQLELLNRSLAQTQQRMVQIEKLTAIGQLANGIAHELNTPLGVIMSNLSVLSGYSAKLGHLAEVSRQAADDLRAGQPTQTIGDALDAAVAISDLDYILEDLPALTTESISSATRITEIVRSIAILAQEGSTQLVPVNVEEALEAAITLVWSELKHRGEVVRAFGGVPRVRGNSSELTQVFVHLLRNATHSLADRGGVVTVTTSHENKQILVRVADNGHGISTEHLARVFEPFFTTRDVGKGTGLGLAVCHGIVTRHDGTIEIQSVRTGGTTVTIKLPAA